MLGGRGVWGHWK